MAISKSTINNSSHFRMLMKNIGFQNLFSIVPDSYPNYVYELQNVFYEYNLT